jgi:hypothetical protein
VPSWECCQLLLLLLLLLLLAQPIMALITPHQRHATPPPTAFHACDPCCMAIDLRANTNMDVAATPPVPSPRDGH